MDEETLKKFIDVGQAAQRAVDEVVPRFGKALKGAWEVKAGLVPMQPMEHFTKRFLFTSEDDEFDRKANPNGANVAYHSKLAKLRAEAMDYFLQVSLPQLNNWATITFIWY